GELKRNTSVLKPSVLVDSLNSLLQRLAAIAGSGGTERGDGGFVASTIRWRSSLAAWAFSGRDWSDLIALMMNGVRLSVLHPPPVNPSTSSFAGQMVMRWPPRPMASNRPGYFSPGIHQK